MPTTTQFPVMTLDAVQLPARPVHLAIGMFDGVHLGHQSVIKAAQRQAERSGGISAVLTFDPHPSRLFRPQEPTRLILPLDEKERRLAAFGVQAIIVQPFTETFAGATAEAFLMCIRESMTTLSGVYVGENFRFGKGRKGDIDTLISGLHAHGIGVYSAPRLRHDGEPISSTRIRSKIEDGRMAAVNELLGYNYSCTRTVVSGKQLGRTLGFPTINLPWAPELPPRYGVYAVRVKAPGVSDNWIHGVANYGLRPSVEATTKPQLEVHFLEPHICEPGNEVTVEWLRFQRPEQRFAGTDALKAQIAIDTEAARAYLANP